MLNSITKRRQVNNVNGDYNLETQISYLETKKLIEDSSKRLIEQREREKQNRMQENQGDIDEEDENEEDENEDGQDQQVQDNDQD